VKWCANFHNCRSARRAVEHIGLTLAVGWRGCTHPAFSEVYVEQRPLRAMSLLRVA
jgi:hypothetical protein